MPDTYNYPVEIERDEDDRFVVAFPDFGWGATDGATRDEALAEARDLLRELIATTIREGGDLPEPSRTGRARPLVVPPVQIALKAALYEAWRQAGISQRRLARDLDVAESEVRRMLNPRTQHQGCNDRPRPAPAGEACDRDGRRDTVIGSIEPDETIAMVTHVLPGGEYPFGHAVTEELTVPLGRSFMVGSTT